MATKNYNSFPEAAEVLVGLDGTPHLVRARQSLEQVLANELPLPPAAVQGQPAAAAAAAARE